MESTESQGRRRSDVGTTNRRLNSAARQRAFNKLAQLHPEQFQTLLETERRADGWTPLRVGRPKVEANQ